MGSDLYMARQYWQPREHVVKWVGKGPYFELYVDTFLDGYKKVLRTQMTPEVRKVLKALGTNIPRKPRDND